ncbi:DUF4376 domain-containing protein [Ralstonia pseudosolanacearum]|uniref:DUF4376 domain-containing protein n=1 Tax=Ralstonia solanacearum species complex TaxID=3116862 RepID=UPI0020033FB4|nr:DUF4376 domain-containing protein [Ralstonia pseudosolanacearum]MCK4121416.1 DUF4376 domain-containing protein [Ralstonia pseudosolanacearum]
MATVNVQFADSSESVVVGVFACEQDANAYPNQAQIDSTDPRYVAFANPSATVPGAQAAQVALLRAAYAGAIAQSVSYTSKGGITKTYQVDPQSVANLSQMLLAFQAPQAVPTGFYWVAVDNAQVPFTYADMQALAQVMGVQGATAFQKLQSLKAEVNAATTVAAIQAVTW